MTYRSYLRVVCLALVGCGPGAGSDGDAGTGLDTSGEGAVEAPKFEPCREDADCPGSAPLCWIERRLQEEGEAGGTYWLAVSLCTRPCESDADCGAGGEADARCLVLDEQRLCGLACSDCDDSTDLECAHVYTGENLCANVVPE